MAKKPASKPRPKQMTPEQPAPKPLTDKQAALRRDYPREFDLGQRAARSGIPASQMPVLEGDAKKAWLEGHG